MLIYQLNNPPVPGGAFHQLHDLPSWLVPLTYQDIILDMKERFPYLQVAYSNRGGCNSCLVFAISSMFDNVSCPDQYK